VDFLNNVDPWSFLLVVVCAIALFGLARWARIATEGGDFQMNQDSGLPFPTQEKSWSTDSPPVIPVDPAFGPEPQLGPIRITKFYFSKFDLTAGPPDAYSFYDELFVELYDSDSGSRWMQSYGVATPQGLTQILNDKQWNYLYANGIIVVPRYDLSPIREAVVARIAEDNELYKPEKKVQEESLYRARHF
jgi:hypothetical protein